MKTKTITKRTIAIVGVMAMLAMAVGVLGVNVVKATNTVATHTVTFNNKATMDISIDNATVAFGDMDPATYPSGSPKGIASAVTLTCKSNKTWALNVKSESANFTSGANNIAIGHLTWQKHSGTGYVAMTTSDAAVLTGQAATASQAQAMDYKLYVDWTDPVADNYTATIDYTISQP